MTWSTHFIVIVLIFGECLYLFSPPIVLHTFPRVWHEMLVFNTISYLVGTLLIRIGIRLNFPALLKQSLLQTSLAKNLYGLKFQHQDLFGKFFSAFRATYIHLCLHTYVRTSIMKVLIQIFRKIKRKDVKQRGGWE